MLFCYGDINIDTSLQIPHVPSEDEEVPISTLNIALGGSATNFASHIAKFGVDVAITGSIGNDSYGEIVKKELDKKCVNHSLLNISSDEATGNAIILVDSSKNRRILTHRGANNVVNMDFLSSAEMKQCRYFHFSSPHELCLENFPFEDFKDVTFSIDAGSLLCSSRADVLRNVLPYMTFLFINSVELSYLSEDGKVSSELVKEFGCQHIIHKEGKNGSTIYSRESHFSVPTFPVEVVDTTGAGDSYAAGFIFKYYGGGSTLKECALFASAVGSLNVKEFGAQTVIPTAEQVQSFLSLQGEL